MIKHTRLILVFIVIFLIDGLVVPGVFGFRESIITTIFLFAMILNWGASASVLWLGSGFSLFLEFFWRIQPSSLSLLFLVAALLYFFISSAFSVKRYAGAATLSFGLGLMFWHNGFIIIVTAFADFLLCFFLFDKLCLEEKNTKFL